MKYDNNLVIVRGGGDIATGAIQCLHRSGFKVIVLETKMPSAIRRTVALCQCVYDKKCVVEDLIGVLAEDLSKIDNIFLKNEIPIIIDEKLEILEKVKPIAIVDAILAKKNLGTNINLAPIVVALGPGFVVGEDCHIAIETARGHDLSRLIFNGMCKENTGIPGEIKGETIRRVLRSPCEGIFKSNKSIGDIVKIGEVIATVDNMEVRAEISGLLRGLLFDGYYVTKNFKIGDIDPRETEYENAFTISDKARSIGGSVLEAILILKRSI